MPRTVDDAFSEFLSRLTPTPGDREAAVKHRSSVEAALASRMTINRFFETGSFSHGTGVRHYSDVDVLASIGGDRPESSDTALRRVKDALTARFTSSKVYVSRPAVVVIFSGERAWEVIPGYITGRGKANQFVYDIPGPSSGWIDSAPQEHLAYVNESNSSPKRGCAKSLARLLKAWKYYCDVPVSSFYLEMRAAEHVRTQKYYIPVWDVCQILEKLEDHGLAAMNDPKKAAGRIRACSTETNRAADLSKLGTATTRARLALDADQDKKPDSAFHYLDRLFGGHFPTR